MEVFTRMRPQGEYSQFQIGALIPSFARAAVNRPLLPQAIMYAVATIVAGRVYVKVLNTIVNCLIGYDSV
jgi:hypothetical protein